MRYVAVTRNYFIPFLNQLAWEPPLSLPLSKQVILAFVISRIDETGSANSGDDAINAIKWVHRMLGVDQHEPMYNLAKDHVGVIKKLRAGPKKQGKIAQPLVVRHIFQEARRPGSNLAHLRLAAIVACQLGGFLRAIDVLRLTRSEIFLMGDRIVLFAAQTKTGRYRQGHMVSIMRAADEFSFCSIIEDYLRAVDLLAPPPDSVTWVAPIFRRITGGKAQRIAAPKLPYLPHVSRNVVAKGLQSCLKRFPDQDIAQGVTLHGFRATAATVAAARLPIAVVKRQGRWSPGSVSVRRYIEPSDSMIERPSQVLAD